LAEVQTIQAAQSQLIVPEMFTQQDISKAPLILILVQQLPISPRLEVMTFSFQRLIFREILFGRRELVGVVRITATQSQLIAPEMFTQQDFSQAQLILILAQ
jgi:hypothetical protein